MKTRTKKQIMRHSLIFTLASSLALSTAGFLISVLACDMNVREAGFLNNAGGPYAPQQHVLCFLFPRESPEIKDFADRMLKVCGEVMPGSNLDGRLFVMEKLKESTRKELAAYGVDTNNLPAAVLMQERQYDMKVVLTFPGLMKDDDLRALAASPKRQELKDLLSDNNNYCVFLFLTGTDQTATAKARKLLTTVLAEHKEQMPKQKIPILTVDRTAPAEKLFFAEFAIKDETKDPIVAMVFGKGRTVMPILKGEDISAEALHRQLAFVNHNASDCTGDAVLLPGSTMDMILPWSAALDKKVFEAIVKSGVIPTLVWKEATVDPATGEIIEPAGARGAGDASGTMPEPPLEGPVTPAVAAAPTAPAAPEPPLAAPPTPVSPPAARAPATAAPAPASTPAWLYVIPASIGILVIAVIVSWFVFFRRMDR